MTLTTDPVTVEEEPTGPRLRVVAPAVPMRADRGPAALPDVRAILRASAWWAIATVLGIAVVAYLVGPLIAERDQRALLGQLRQDVNNSVGEVEDSLLGAAPVNRSPSMGDPVALLQVQRLGWQQVIVEGAGPSQTRSAPGHLPGTAAPGQPGNAVVVGRQHLYGKAFADLASLQVGDQIVMTSRQGQSLYVVSEVPASTSFDNAVTERSDNDRLTLMTSASRWPWTTGTATVVVAELKTKPFTPTPQNGRSEDQNGRSTQPSAVALTLLCLLGFVTVAAVASLLYRRWSVLGTYVATTPALVGLLVPTALAASLLLPAWA